MLRDLFVMRQRAQLLEREVDGIVDQPADPKPAPREVRGELKPFFSTVVRTVYTLSTRAAFAIATFTLMMLGRSKFDTPNKAPKRAR